MKRAFDLVAAATGMILLLPVFLLLAIIVVATSGFPVYFRQRRVGRNGRDFVLLKFRTMTELSGAEAGSFDAGRSRRVTPAGRLLRKAKLDELPQLWNVVKGDMSLVGPRPEVRKWVETYPERWASIHRIRPGITDPASIEFRDEEAILARAEDPERLYCDVVLPRKLDLYEEYVRNRTFTGDLAILLKTFWAVASGSGGGAAG